MDEEPFPEGAGQQVAAGGSERGEHRAQRQSGPGPEQRSGQHVLRAHTAHSPGDTRGVPGPAGSAGQGSPEGSAPLPAPAARPYQEAGAGDGEALLVEISGAEQSQRRAAVLPLVVPQRLGQLPQLLQVRREPQRPEERGG